jgi:hypothetical protein
MKNPVFCVVTPCGSYKNRHFGGTYSLRHQGEGNQQAKNDISTATRRQMPVEVIGMGRTSSGGSVHGSVRSETA